jgi:hypothetical protein
MIREKGKGVSKKGPDAFSLLHDLHIGRLVTRVHKTQSDYQVWEEGSKPKQIGSAEMMLQKLEYIRQNPGKRCYIDDPVLEDADVMSFMEKSAVQQRALGRL